MPKLTSPFMSVVKCLNEQEFRADATPNCINRTVLTLSVQGEQRLVVGEGETGYKALHAAFAKALKDELPEVGDCPTFPAEDNFGVMLEYMFDHFDSALRELYARERPRHPSGRTATGREYRHDGARDDEYGPVGTSSCLAP